MFLILAAPLGHLFGKDAEVARYITLYLLITPVSYGSRGCAFLVASVFNAMNRPMLATGLNLMRMFILYIPMAIIGSWLGGLAGLFMGLCLANFGAGILSIIIGRLTFHDSCLTI